ncbi:hypothetical protein O9992_00560 [Vibrio lentus]|nr:hypothetical protein [Vibrio lentus]
MKLHPECFGSSYEAQSQLPTLYFEGLLKVAIKKVMIGAFVGEDLVSLCGLTPVGGNALGSFRCMSLQDLEGKPLGPRC